MTAIAFAAMSLPLLLTAPSEARDNERHGNHRASNSEFFGGAMRDNRHFKRRHVARFDRGFSRGFGTVDRGFSRGFANIDRGFGSIDRGFSRGFSRGFGTVDRGWQNAGQGWGPNYRFGGSQRDRPAPYYTGSGRPYYAGQYRLYNSNEMIAGNFYGGAISGYQDPGNGYYFYANGDGYGGIGDGGGYPTPASSNRGKLIVVTPETENASCSWEAGVCVIRP